MCSTVSRVRRLLCTNSGRLDLRDIYRVYLGKRQGQHVWIVDGARVAGDIYPAFVMGGNDQRYRFNPENEVWIDNRIAIEELGYTLAHELIERKLMRERGWSYDRAHSEGGLQTERKLRFREQKRVASKERAMQPVSLGEWGSPSRNLRNVRVPLNGVYRYYYGKVDGVAIWIVDGNKVRRDLDADFCFGAHDYEYRFIPRGEIWIDAAISVEEAPFTIVHELCLRSLMASGKSYSGAYEIALAKQFDERARQAVLCRKHEAKLAPVRYGVRERGVKSGRSAGRKAR